VRVCILDECIGCFFVHENNNLFARGSLGDYIELRLGLALTTVDNLLNLINLVILEFWEYFFDLESVHHCVGVLGFK